MREATQPEEGICVVCKQPIIAGKHVAIDLKHGEYCHATCYNEYERQQKSRKYN